MKFKTYISKDNLKGKQKIQEDKRFIDIDEEIEKSYTDKCKKDNEQYISIEDLDRFINGMYLSDDSKKELGIIKRYLEKLILIIERSRIRDYMYLTDSKRRLFIINFIAGVAKGFGQAIGFTILAAVALALLFSWVDLPIIGRYIAKLLNIVQQYRK
ncbi:DUF5665 domain-containing protein [Terrisporobacter sp.]|uniref:DUF5665 domain-containing protein n=1 Tax=Terrisporobacter sp. TaxID=1965305 RepID=UPI0026099B6F|nr:DUF5665 domain-containing protein [Terrisporobacter sp.]